MFWIPWSKIDYLGIARYVDAELIGDTFLPNDVNRLDILNQGSYDVLIKRIYEHLCSFNIQYALSPYHQNKETQKIRSPQQIVFEHKEGTCLDLTVLFCSICLRCNLLPVVIFTERHSFAAISLQQDSTKYRYQVSTKGKIDPKQLYELVERDGYLAIECTGFSYSGNAAGDTELRDQNSGFLAFEDACKKGKALLENYSTIQFVADIASLHGSGIKPIIRELADLPMIFSKALYDYIPKEYVNRLGSESSFIAFQEVCSQALAAAVQSLARSSEFNHESIEYIANFVTQSEVIQYFAQILFSSQKDNYIDMMELHKVFETKIQHISPSDFDNMMAVLLEHFEQASVQHPVLREILTTQLIRQIAIDIRSGHIENQRKKQFEALEAMIWKQAQQWLERNQHTDAILRSGWGGLLLRIYPFIVAGFANQQADIEAFCDWLTRRDLDKLAVYTRNQISNIVGKRDKLINTDSFWPGDATQEWSIEVDKLLQISDFTWLSLIRQSLSLNGLDLLFEIRLYTEIRQIPNLTYRTWQFIRPLPQERSLNPDKLHQQSKEIQRIVELMRSFQNQKQLILQRITIDPKPRLRELGFFSAEELLAMHQTALQPCRPLPSRLQERTGYSHWPLECDIKHGYAVQTESLIELRQYIDQKHIVLLQGQWGIGKTTCARMYAYEWIINSQHQREVFYFGNLGLYSESTMVERYAQLPVDEIIDLLRNINEPLVILDDIQYGFEIVGRFAQHFTQEFFNKKLILISNSHYAAIPEQVERIFSNIDLMRISLKLDWQDVKRLLQSYWPEHIHQPDNILNQKEMRVIQKWFKFDWSLLHIYIDRFDDEQYRRLARNQVPYFNHHHLSHQLFDQRLLKLKQDLQHVLWELCALISIQVPVLDEYVQNDRERQVSVQHLMNEGLIVKQITNFNQQIAYTLHIPRLADYYLDAADKQNHLRQTDALPGENNPTLQTISRDEFIVRAMVRYLLASPANYTHIFLLAFTTRRDYLLRSLLSRNRPWHQDLLNQIITLMNNDKNPVLVATALHLLRRVDRNLLQEVLDTRRKPHFNPLNIIKHIRNHINSDDSIDLQQGMLALRHLRLADRDWSRRTIVESAVRRDDIIQKLTNASLSISSQLFAEVYRLKPSYARDILARMTRENKKEILEQRIIIGIGISSTESNFTPNNLISEHISARLIEITSFLDSIALADHDWVRDLLAKIGFQPFTQRILMGVEPAIFIISVSQLFRVSPSFVYHINKMWLHNPDMMISLAASFSHPLQRFSVSLRSLSELAETLPRLARRIFDSIPLSEWKKKWRKTPYVSELNSGLRNLLAFYNEGAMRLLATFQVDEITEAIQQSLTPSLKPYFLSGLVLILAELRPDMLTGLIENLGIDNIIDIFDSDQARLPSIALLISGLTYLNNKEEEDVLEIWTQLVNRIEYNLFNERKPNDVKNFYVYLKNNMISNGHATLRNKIALTADVLIQEGLMTTIVHEIGDLVSISHLLNGVSFWSRPEIVQQFLYDQESILINRLKKSRDVTEMGIFLQTIGKLDEIIHRRMIEQIEWKFIIEDFKNEFKLGRIVTFLEGLFINEGAGNELEHLTNAEDRDGSFKLPPGTRLQLQKLADEFIIQIDDEPSLGTISNLLFALWKADPETASIVTRGLSTTKLLARLRSEPRIAVICKVLSGISRIDTQQAISITNDLASDAEELSIKLFLEQRLDLLALDLFRLRGGEWAQSEARQSDTASKILSAKAFDQDELARRIQYEASNLRVASLLYNLTMIDHGKAREVLSKVNDLHTWLRERPDTVEPATIALLFALRLVSPRYSKILAKRLIKCNFLSILINESQDVRFIAWGIREFALNLSDQPNEQHFFEELPWDALTTRLIEAWNFNDITVWELGWCIWALTTHPSLRQLNETLRHSILTRFERTLLEQLKKVKQPIYRAFGMLGFGLELAQSYSSEWIEMAHDLRKDLPAPPGNILIYNDDEDNSIQQIAESIGFVFEYQDEAVQSNNNVIENLIWSFCWQWFHLGTFSFRDSERDTSYHS